MTSRERLCAALNNQPVDRVPWAPLMDDYFVSSLPAQGYEADLIAAADLIGCDLMERHVAGPIAHYHGLTVTETPLPDGIRTTYETPLGTLWQEARFSGQTRYTSRHLIHTVEDVTIYQYIAEHTTYEPQVEAFVARDAQIGDRGLATLTGNMSPVQEMLQHLCGVENTVYLMADYPDEMEALFAAMHARNLRQYEALLTYPCDYIFDYEDTSTTVMSRDMFTRYSLPAINAYADRVHQAGKKFIAHMCGKLTGFITEIGSGHQDGVDSVCPPPTGDLYAWDARKAWGRNMVFIGGIDPPQLAMRPAEEIAAFAEQVLARVDNQVGFILSTGDAVPHGTPVENLRAVQAVVLQRS